MLELAHSDGINFIVLPYSKGYVKFVHQAKLHFLHSPWSHAFSCRALRLASHLPILAHLVDGLGHAHDDSSHSEEGDSPYHPGN